MTTISDIFTIQDAVHQGDFVLRLTEGLQAGKRRQTLQQYVVTPQLVQSFRQSLALNGSADFAGFDLQVLGTEPGTSGHKKARDGGGFGVNNALSLEQILVAKGGLDQTGVVDKLCSYFRCRVDELVVHLPDDVAERSDLIQ